MHNKEEKMEAFGRLLDILDEFGRWHYRIYGTVLLRVQSQ